MNKQTIRFEFNPNDIQDVLGKVTEAWNGNPGTKVVTFSSGRLTDTVDSLYYFEAELEQVSFEAVPQP